MDVDARSAWHAVELNTHEVVVSVVGLSVSSDGVDSSRSCILGDNHYKRLLQTLAASLLNDNVVFACLLNLEVRTVNESDVATQEFRSNEEYIALGLAAKPLPAASQVMADEFELGTSLKLYRTCELSAFLVECELNETFGLAPVVE